MRPTYALTTTLLFIVFSWCVCAFALDPSLDVSQYAHTAWKVRDGFAKGQIYSVAQTPDGYLWLGTEFGLVRFDGVRAVPWQPPENQHLPSNIIYNLLVSRDGALWIGTTEGLASWKDNKLTRFPKIDGESIYSLLEDTAGTVWVGTFGHAGPGKLCAVGRGGINCFGSDGRFGSVAALHQDRNGNLWVGVAGGLWKWKPGQPKFYSLPGEPDGITALSEDKDGALLVGWKGGIYRLIDGKSELYRLAIGAPDFRARAILRDRDGSLWIATLNYGLLHVHQDRSDIFSALDGLTGDTTLSLFEDREGNIWVPTSDGLDCLRDYAVAKLTTKQGLSRNLVGSILADKDGSVWLATYGGLNRWDHGKITIPETGSARRDGELGGSNPESSFQDQSGRIWIATARGFGYLENGRFVVIKGVPGGNVQSIDEDASNNLWVANRRFGLFRISPNNKIEKIPWSNLGHQDFGSILAADHKQGGLWIGFSRGGIAYLFQGRFRESYTISDGLGAGRVSDFLFDNEGTLWISTKGGLSRLKNNRIATLTDKNGLPCDTVHWAMEGDDRSMWLYTACGLIRIAWSEVNAWSAAADKQEDATRKVKVTVFDNSDGVRSLANPGFYHPQVAKTPDGKLWFLPWDGVSVIDPRHIPFNKIPPPVHIEQITADRKVFGASENLRLPPLVRDLEIDYTALSLVVPEKNLFRYKLEGLDRDWQDVGNRRQAFYTNLPPRTYRFRVIACNNSGVWNETGDSFEFSIAPAYYQTTWFRLLCVAAFAALLWALYQLRLHQIRRQYAAGLEATVGERMRVARELHDTLLQSFQGAIFQFQAARKLLLRKEDNAMEALDEAIQATEEAIQEGRSAIRDLRPEPAAQRDLPELLNAVGNELATAHELNGSAPAYRVVVEGKQQELSPMLQDEVYRISREVIRNAFAHAAASHIEVEIRYDQDQLRLRVRDDGKGIDPKVLKAGGQSGHFGIPGMRERAQRMGARLDFWSEMGAGTEVELTVPASMAYQKRRDGRRFRLFNWAGKDEQRS